MTDIRNPIKAAQTLYSASLLCESLGNLTMARDLEQFAARVARTPVWERVEPGHYRTVIDGEQTDLRKRPDGQWVLEAGWLAPSGIRWFRTCTEAQGWVKRQSGAA